ncbi:MAG: hypothetical protein ABFS34_01805 [Gemmatimonadota bacterium]
MFELKRLSEAGIAGALDKAERYRLLNEPREAESICRDVLSVDPGNQRARVDLVLSLSDQFGAEGGPSRADVLSHIGSLEGEYEQAYYTGIIHERVAKARHTRGFPGSEHVAYDAFRQAMECFETAQALSPPGDDAALLRWNTCARLLNEHRALAPAPETGPTLLE